MAPTLNFDREQDQVLFTGNSYVKVVILNRPQKLNSLNHEMGNGKAFCAGGDVVSVITSSVAGHWTYAASFYKKQLILDHLVATYKKPIVSLINGVVMGGGAGLSIPTRFRVVTEKAVFAMPEASIGLFPDVGSNYFLSRLPGYFGEYLGLTGARLNGAEMAACGLATHFVPSLKLKLLENALEDLSSPNVSTITALIETFSEKANVKEDSTFRRRGRVQKFEECLYRDYNIACHFFRGTFGYDFYEGSRAKLFHKDNKPKWEPSKLELVDEEMVDEYFSNLNDEEWEFLRFPDRSNSQIDHPSTYNGSQFHLSERTKPVILNRIQKLNILNYEMLSQIKKNLEMYENDPLVKLVILKANGKAFCAGGDVVSVIVCSLAGHWTYNSIFYKKLLSLEYFIATYAKPTVSLINGLVMGGGAGLSINTKFRVVTEKAIFAMPEASIGLFPDVGASFFLSRLPGSFGEYIGLTGARLDGAEMVACGLATHFVNSMKLNSLENVLQTVTSDVSMATVIETFTDKANLKKESSLRRDYTIGAHILRRTVSNDFYEGSRAKLFDKDNKPKWEPSKLELVSDEMVDQCFRNVNDADLDCLKLAHHRSNSQIASRL
ncbi:unnamed protein product [Sphenostylis stenocarpa]|uniref:3-hydroxyisobutyryl-CoA hydrolase n=1 Tax=Sphenostylis stenocarpa TaxID=92480 RepID=A0AA86STI9_9FABA|nr:unnamed protein product [Sphenostylis stenocarpa]